MRNNSTVFINCQSTSIENSGGSGQYALQLEKQIQNILPHIDFNILFVNNFSNSQNKRKLYKKFPMSVKKVVKKATPHPIRKLYRSFFPYIEDKNFEICRFERILLHEISNYGTHQNLAKFIRHNNCSLVTTFLDLQDYHFPEYFSDEILTWRRLNYSFFKSECKKFIAISDFTKRDMIQKLGIPEKEIVTIHLAADLSRTPPEHHFQQFSKTLGNYLIYPAKYWPHKNHDFLLKSIRRNKEYFIKNNYKLVLCGGFTIKEYRHLEQKTKELGIDKISIILKFLKSNDLHHLIQNAQYMVFPSLFEGFGMPVLEANGLGCPVLCSHEGSLPEVAGQSAIFFNPRINDSIDECIQNAFKNVYNRENMIQIGYKNFERFSWETCAKDTIKVYEDIFK